MEWEPRGYVEVPDDEDGDAIWHGTRACGRIRFQKCVVGPIGYLERHEAAGGRWVKNCKCAGDIRAIFAGESGNSIRTMSGGLPTLGKGHR
jgi:hypothetical protein